MSSTTTSPAGTSGGPNTSTPHRNNRSEAPANPGTPPDPQIGDGDEATLPIPTDDGDPTADRPSASAPVPFVSVSVEPVVEGDIDMAGRRPSMAFTISLSHPTDDPVTLRYRTQEDDPLTPQSAEADRDYSGVNSSSLTEGHLVIQPGRVERVVLVYIRGDQEAEDDEHFRFDIWDLSNANAAGPEAIGAILDDD